MPKDRFYIPRELPEGGSIVLDGAEYHHLVNVMRAAIGGRFEFINGRGGYALAQLNKIEKKQAILTVLKAELQQKPEQVLILAQGIPRVNKLDFIIEKGTELGLSALWLFPGERSEKNELSENQLARLNHLAISAMKQCGRLFLPEICVKPPLAKWSDLTLPAYFGSTDPSAPAFYTLLRQPLSNSMLFFVGPEAGFSESEEKVLLKLGAFGVKLNQNILRTETAAIAAVTLMSQFI